MKLKLKKNDLVQVIAGNDKGATGRILALYPDKERVLVEQVNVRKKHTKPNQKNQRGGIISKEMPVHYSNVMLVDGDKKPTRIGIKFEEVDGKKSAVRYAKTNGENV